MFGIFESDRITDLTSNTFKESVLSLYLTLSVAKKIQKVLSAMYFLTLSVAKKIQKVLEAMYKLSTFFDLLPKESVRSFIFDLLPICWSEVSEICYRFVSKNVLPICFYTAKTIKI